MTVALPKEKEFIPNPNLGRPKGTSGSKMPTPTKKYPGPKEGQTRLEWILEILAQQTEEGKVTTAMVGVGKLFLEVEKWRASLPENATQNYEAPKALQKLQAQIDALESYAPEYLNEAKVRKEEKNGS